MNIVVKRLKRIAREWDDFDEEDVVSVMLDRISNATNAKFGTSVESDDIDYSYKRDYSQGDHFNFGFKKINFNTPKV